MKIVWLGESNCNDVSLVGGKAANLSLLAAEYPVPPGFCLTTSAFDSWKAEGGSEVPREIYRLISESYSRLAELSGTESPSVAVRSSAIDEDGASASFAGQHDTYLNITAVDPVTDAIQSCWNSLTNDHALEYRRQQGLSSEGLSLAVLVQLLIPADASGVVFSANPITGSRDESIINASWGLGESVVNGTVTPDTYIVRSSDVSIIESEISDKEVMTVPIDNGTTEVNVPEDKRSLPVLNENQIKQTINLALSLQATMGWPVDVEWAFRGSDLYLLQCRPITTL